MTETVSMAGQSTERTSLPWCPMGLPSFLLFFFFFKDFLKKCGPFLEYLYNFVTIFYFLFSVFVFWSQGMWNLSFARRDGTTPPALEGKVLTNERTREVPGVVLLSKAWHTQNG